MTRRWKRSRKVNSRNNDTKSPMVSRQRKKLSFKRTVDQSEQVINEGWGHHQVDRKALQIIRAQSKWTEKLCWQTSPTPTWMLIQSYETKSSECSKACMVNKCCSQPPSSSRKSITQSIRSTSKGNAQLFHEATSSPDEPAAQSIKWFSLGKMS